MRITQRTVEALKADPERDVFAWDDQLDGFGVRVYPSGTRKFIAQWKRDGRTRRLVLGTFPLMKAEQARGLAVETLAAVERGEDPAGKRDAAKASPTVQEVCERWIERGIGRKGRPKRASTLAADRSRVESHVTPHPIGRMKIQSLRQEHMHAWVQAVARGDMAFTQKLGPRARRDVTGGPAAAARCLRTLKAALAFAVREGLIQTNPATDVHPPENAEPERERYLSPRELAHLGRALAAAERAGLPWQAIASIRLILATGLRKNEALALRWENVDLERRRLVLPETKTGRSVRPLSREAVAVLIGLQGRSTGGWVFPATAGDGHYIGLQKPWARIRKAALISDVHLHDLRHSFGAAAASSGTSLLTIGRMLGHKKARSTERYAHVAPDAAADAADRVAGSIAAAVQGRGSK